MKKPGLVPGFFCFWATGMPRSPFVSQRSARRCEEGPGQERFTGRWEAGKGLVEVLLDGQDLEGRPTAGSSCPPERGEERGISSVCSATSGRFQITAARCPGWQKRMACLTATAFWTIQKHPNALLPTFLPFCKSLLTWPFFVRFVMEPTVKAVRRRGAGLWPTLSSDPCVAIRYAT